MPRKPAPAPLAPDATSGTLALLRAVAGEEMFAEALPLLRERMGLTPEKLSLLLFRELCPDAIPEKGEEAILRDFDASTLKKHKDAHLLPERMGFRETRPLLA